MAESSGFFNAHFVNGEYDRIYLAEQFAKYFANFISNGIFGGKSDELVIRQREVPDMSVNALSGKGYINGYWYDNDGELPLIIDVADGVLHRIDRIVLRWSSIDRIIRLNVKKGAPASSPRAPSLQRDSDFYELGIAEIYVRAGATKITQADILDTRLNSEVCGFVVALIQQFDTTEFGKQLDGYISNYAAEYKAYLEELEIAGTKEINDLIDRLNAIIEDESAFATLTLKTDNIANESALTSQTLGYEKKNLIPYPYTYSSNAVTGITWTDNKDGTITANGVAAAICYFTFYDKDTLKPGKYLLTSGFNDSDKCYVFFIKVKKSDGSYAGRTRSIDNKIIEITQADLNEYNFLISAYIEKDFVASNVIFKPMLRRAEILNSTWEPYKLSVAEMIQEDETNKGCFYRINRFTKVKEWINPPSAPGIEYCTTERWNNKPVYQKTFYAASLPNNSVMTFEVNASFNSIISIDGFAVNADDNYHYAFPVILDGATPVAVIRHFEGDGGNGGIVVVKTTDDVSYMQAYITVKYTKA